MQTHHAHLSRRALLAAATAGLATSTLAGCSGGTVTGNGGGGTGKAEITVWYTYTGAAAKKAEELIAAYNASQAQVSVVGQYAASSVQFNAKLINAIKNGTAPDMVLGDSTPQQLGQVIQTGKVLPLESYLTATGASVSTKSFTAGMLATGTFAGKVYALPTDAGDFAVVYNKQMFQEAGISATPSTWAELQADAKRLTKGTSQYGIYLPIGTGEWPVYTWQAMLWSAGGEFLNTDNTKVAFNSPAGVTALTAWTDMVKAGTAYPQSLMTATDNGGTAALSAKKAAMAISTAATLATIDQALGDGNVGVFKLPGITRDAMNMGTNVSYLLASTSAKQDAAWAFLQYWLSPDSQAAWDIATGYFPTNGATATSATWKGYLDQNPRRKVFNDQLAYAQARPSITAYAAVSAALSEQLQAAMLGATAPADALAKAAVTAQAALDK